MSLTEDIVLTLNADPTSSYMGIIFRNVNPVSAAYTYKFLSSTGFTIGGESSTSISLIQALFGGGPDGTDVTIMFTSGTQVPPAAGTVISLASGAYTFNNWFLDPDALLPSSPFVAEAIDGNNGAIVSAPVAVPEPGSITLLGLVAIGGALRICRKRA